MIINLLICLVVIFLGITVSLPFFLCSILKKSFEQVQMKQTSPIGIRGILLKSKGSLWGLQHFILFISSFRIGFNAVRFRIKFTAENIQLFFTRKMKSLVSVDPIQGFQQAKILFNFLHHCLNNKMGSDESGQIKQEDLKKQQPLSTFQYLWKGIVHLIVLLLLHIVEIELVDLKIFVVSAFPQELVDLKDKKRRNQSLMAMHCLAEYTIYCDKIAIQCAIDHHQKYKLIFSCNQIPCSSFQHWKSPFFQINQIMLQITIPFSMSMSHSYSQLNFKLSVGNSILNLIPTDFDHFFHLIREFSFDPSLGISSKSKDEKQSKHELQINFDLITINFQEIFEQDYDNREAKEYLTNINSTVITLENFKLDASGLSIKQSNLAVAKYNREQTLSRILQVLKIPNLKIKSIDQDLVTEVTHDDVVINCYSQEIALLGKIFSLVNNRIRFQNYNAEIYREVQRKYHVTATIFSLMDQMLAEKSQRQSQKQQISLQKKHKLVYLPKRLTLFLEMKKLRHILTIEGFTYTRENRINEMSHEINMQKLLVQHKQLKEFIVKDFKLTYSLTTLQDNLTIIIKDIIMNQNEATLTDYLDSYTLLKHILQVQSDQKEKITKFAKKNVSIESIILNIGHQKIELTSLQLDQESHVKQILNKVYFTIQKFEVILGKLRPNKKLMRPYVNSKTGIFSFKSLSITKSLELRHSKPKERVTIIVKNPTVNIPEVNIASRIVSYLEMFSRMNNNIQAYLRNVSNQKLKFQKYNIKETISEPSFLELDIVDLKFFIADNKLDHSILSFSRTVREDLYLSHNRRDYNEAEILNVLRRNNKNKEKNMLMQINIKKIRLIVNPIPNLQTDESSILAYAGTFYPHNTKSPYDSLRIKRAKMRHCNFEVEKIEFKIRDYPHNILQISKIIAQGSILQLKRIFGSKQYFIKCSIQMGELTANIGLGQLSGLMEINKRMNELNSAQQCAQTMLMEQQDSRQKYDSVHKILQAWKWNIEFKKQSQSHLNWLTGITPYEQDKFQLKFGQWHAISNCNETSLKFLNLQIGFKEMTIVSIPQIEVTILLGLVKKQLDLQVKTVFSKETSINMSSDLVRYVQDLKQIRKEWLLIFGIYEVIITTKKIQLQDIQNMNYMQIAQLLLKQRMRKVSNNSLLNFIQHLKFTTHFDSVHFAIIEDDLQLALSLDKINIFNTLKPNHDLYNSFQVIRSKIEIENIAVCFLKKRQNQMNDYQAQMRLNNIQRNRLQFSKVIKFLNMNYITINFNWYFIEDKTVGRANVWLDVKQIQGELSKKLMQYSKRIHSIYNRMPQSQQYEKHQKVTKPLSKFRKAVLEIIAINRRNRIKQGHVKKFKLVLNVGNCKFILKNNRKQLIFESKKKAILQQGIQYSQTDHYHAKPQTHLMILLPLSVVSVTDGDHSSEIMQIAIMKIVLIGATNDQVSCGYCCLQDVQVQMSVRSKNALNELIDFMVQVTRTSAQRKQIRRAQAKKYSELKNNKRQKIAQTIRWKQSDLKYSEVQQFRWQFQILNLKLQLLQRQRTLTSGKFSSINLLINLFSNSKISQNVSLKYFSLINQLQSENSDYRYIIQTDKEKQYFQLFTQKFQVKAFSDVIWDYFKDISIKIEPLKVKITEEFVGFLVEYFQQPQTTNDEEYNQEEKYKSKIPDYYKLLKIEPMKLQLWFKSQNPFKRMQGITVLLNEYLLKEELCTKAELGRWWGMWLVKQLAGQALGILQQKIMGTENEDRL